MTEKKYKKPPVQEALCEIFFSGQEWDDTVPGSFYGDIKDNYPTKTQLKHLGIELNLGQKERTTRFHEKDDRIQFRKPDGSQIIQLGPEMLVVNQLRPYPRFETWLPVLKDKFNLYSKYAKPKNVEKIGIRYINRIVIPQSEIKMEHYFDIYPNLPKALGDKHGPFMIRMEMPTKFEKHRLIITFASAPSEQPNTTAFALDLYDTFAVQLPPNIDEVTKVAKEGHDNIVLAFENCIRDPLREIFEEEKS